MAGRGLALPLAAIVVGAALAGCERSVGVGVGVGGVVTESVVRTGSSTSAAPLLFGQLAARPDGDLFAFLPTQDDFPPDAFLAPSPAGPETPRQTGERELPETDPPGCAAGNPAFFRANSVSASLASEDSGKRAVALSIGKLVAGHAEAQQVEDWIARCGRYRSPPSFGGVEGDETVSLAPRDAPELGLDEIVSYEQRVTGSVRTEGSGRDVDVDERAVVVFGQARGVFVSASWCDDQDRDLALQLLEGLVDRIRSA